MQYELIQKEFKKYNVNISNILFLLFSINLFGVFFIDNLFYKIVSFTLISVILIFSNDIQTRINTITINTIQKYSFIIISIIFILLIGIFLIIYYNTSHKIFYLQFIFLIALTHFILTFFPDYFLNRLAMMKLLNFNIYLKEKTNLLHSSKEYKNHRKRIYIYVTKTGNQYNIEKNSLLLYRFYELFMFWYANAFYQFKYRLTMTLFFIFISIISFLSFIYLLDHANIDNFQNSLLIIVYLIFLSMVMLLHINSFLNTDDILNKIDKDLNKFFFKTSTNRQKILLFFQKNYTVYIDDKIANRRIILNDNIDFRKMVKDGFFDEKGRNLIVTIFMSILFIVFIQLSSVMFIAQPNKQDTNYLKNQTKAQNVINKHD